MTARELFDQEAAIAHVEFLTGMPAEAVNVRLIHDSDKRRPTNKLFGTVHDLWSDFELAQ